MRIWGRYQIQHDQGNTPSSQDQVGCSQCVATVFYPCPQHPPQIDALRSGSGGIERIGPINQDRQLASLRHLRQGPERQRQPTYLAHRLDDLTARQPTLERRIDDRTARWYWGFGANTQLTATGLPQLRDRRLPRSRAISLSRQAGQVAGRGQVKPGQLAKHAFRLCGSDVQVNRFGKIFT